MKTIRFLPALFSVSAAVALLGVAPDAQAFTCGPHLHTYRVRPLDNRSGEGVRCVNFGPNNAYRLAQYPIFSWYGEGNWNGSTYRHVGAAFGRRGSSVVVGFASDIDGNGEAIHYSYDGNLGLTLSNYGVPNTITVGGAWNERWELVPNGSVRYTSALRRVRHCGSYFREYHVSDASGTNRRGEGVRCELQIGPSGVRGPRTWYGDGEWNGATYAHLGLEGRPGYGASDLCETSKYSICNTFAQGSLIFGSAGGGWHVGGSWAENWH